MPSSLRTRTVEEYSERSSEIGLSNTSTAPDIFRGLHKEMTVQEVAIPRNRMMMKS